MDSKLFISEVGSSSLELSLRCTAQQDADIKKSKKSDVSLLKLG